MTLYKIILVGNIKGLHYQVAPI